MGEIKLSEIGRIAHQCWIEIPDHYSDVLLDDFIIMPNHIHAIIQIGQPQYKEAEPQYKMIPIIMGSFKSAVSRSAHEKGYKDFS